MRLICTFSTSLLKKCFFRKPLIVNITRDWIMLTRWQYWESCNSLLLTNIDKYMGMETLSPTSEIIVQHILHCKINKLSYYTYNYKSSKTKQLKPKHLPSDPPCQKHTSVGLVTSKEHTDRKQSKLKKE